MMESAAKLAAEYDLGLVLTGGGARGAYQVGVLRWIARNYPDIHPPILTGVSAGAVNTAKLAAHPGTFRQAVEELEHLWRELTIEHVFRVDAATLSATAVRLGGRLVTGGLVRPRVMRALLDTQPLRELLTETLAPVGGEITGIDYNVAQGRLRAVGIITTSYSTGQTVVWLKGRQVAPWKRPQRRTEVGPITVEHIMASAALPIFFPAVRIGNEYFGDGGIRLAAPLSPALHLGADRILSVSTRYERTRAESGLPTVVGYPPPAQVLGVLLNAVFLDVVDQDAARLLNINRLLAKVPPEERGGMRLIRFISIRPSVDLAELAAGYEARLPRAFRFMVRGLGTREQRSPDVLAMLLFDAEYLGKLIDLGEADAERRAEELHGFLTDTEDPALTA
ncbi:MAG TPA: patatin-like phospholipase family protein [Longimicrobiales bacterium]|nr:patatin-like phospholipase family protein [Longimicrobiales bacterium]